jgi:outer membrane protein TolC
VSQVRYLAGVSQQTGVSPQLELSNAQISLTQAESNRVNALYDYNVARAQLDHAMGRYAFVGAGPGLKDVPPKTLTTKGH